MKGPFHLPAVLEAPHPRARESWDFLRTPQVVGWAESSGLPHRSPLLGPSEGLLGRVFVFGKS